MKVDLSRIGLSGECLNNKLKDSAEALDLLISGNQDMTGWMQIPTQQNKQELNQIVQTSKEIQSRCDLFVVLGIGGSSLGAKAMLEALNEVQEKATQVLFAGDSLDASALKNVADRMRHKESCLCVISKSGTTLETLISFSYLKEVMKEKYGDQAAGRIYTVTDAQNGVLREETQKEGYESFPIPRDIGGRYSVLTAVGLFPLAVGGVDIRRLLEGAESIAKDPASVADAARYAAARVCLGETGKRIEALESFDPSMETFGQWLKQLFGESEGKEGKGIYPTVLTFTRDLHSVGQFLQEGAPVIFETMILFDKNGEEIITPSSAGESLAGLSIQEVNACVTKGVITAHTKAGIPIITVTLPTKDAFCMGQLIHFFELSSSMSATMLGVDPFNQPGVERYKKEAWQEIDKLWSSKQR